MEIKLYLKSLLWIFIPLIVILLIVNTLYYFDILSNSFIRYLKIIVMLLSCFIGGFARGINSPNRGYIYGLKLSGIVVFFLLVVGLILREFSLKSILYYLIIIIAITLGSMVGINKRKTS